LTIFPTALVFEGTEIPCYSIEEIVAEKFRALLQRSYAAPRDYYDLWYILKQNMADWDKILSIIKLKFKYKGIAWNGYRNFFQEEKIGTVTNNWNNSLRHHVRDSEFPDAKTVVSELESICKSVAWSQ
jgi:predicted nucleotidyltransferase component of viral defense system